MVGCRMSGSVSFHRKRPPWDNRLILQRPGWDSGLQQKEHETGPLIYPPKAFPPPAPRGFADIFRQSRAGVPAPPTTIVRVPILSPVPHRLTAAWHAGVYELPLLLLARRMLLLPSSFHPFRLQAPLKCRHLLSWPR